MMNTFPLSSQLTGSKLGLTSGGMLSITRNKTSSLTEVAPERVAGSLPLYWPHHPPAYRAVTTVVPPGSGVGAGS